MLLLLTRLSKLRESKRNALLSLIVQLAVTYFIAYIIVCHYAPFVTFVSYYTLVLSGLAVIFLIVIIVSDILIKKYTSNTYIDTLIKTLNMKINTDKNFRKAVLNVSQDPNNKTKIDDLITKYFKENIEVKKISYFILISIANGLAYILLLSVNFILLNEVYHNVFSYDDRLILCFTGIAAYILFIRNEIIANEKEDQTKYERFAILYFSSLMNRIINTKYVKNTKNFDKIIYYLLMYISVPLSIYTVVNSLFSNDNTSNSQKTINATLIYISNDEVLKESCIKGSPEMEIKCEENIKSFLTYIAKKFNAKIAMRNKEDFIKSICSHIKKAEIENSEPFNSLCNKNNDSKGNDSKSSNKSSNNNGDSTIKNNDGKNSDILVPYNIGKINMLNGNLFLSDMYKIEKLLENVEILDISKSFNSIIILTKEGESVSGTSLIMLRTELEIKDVIVELKENTKIGAKKFTVKFKKTPISCNCNLNYAIFLSE